ncbi:hypothetical protein M3P21_17885 [Ruegeria sp. 2012CJ41-6]|uniref:Uncharacterized protein n=1 Tax=Ruegeria spongiae TaxID=2942209 RepID=A0ABT0Q8A6_9RHOB|nr:hypothetical protein [Ruegeria spongiae]MCL6285403.1 hypothetical protein [Ruegeria spongiae]
MKTVLCLAMFIGFLISTGALLNAQSYPIGACILPSGQWCIPPSTGYPGSICSCLTEDGWMEGIQN